MKKNHFKSKFSKGGTNFGAKCISNYTIIQGITWVLNDKNILLAAALAQVSGTWVM